VLVYKIVTAAQWESATTSGRFTGAPVDLADGYIHFSAAAQVAETLAKHFAGEAGLLLVAVDTTSLGDALRWEVSRGGALFPPPYAPLPVSRAHSVRAIPLRDGVHDLDGLL